jgi:hypothetical protein
MKLSLISRVFFLISCLILASCAKKNHPPVVQDQEFSISENSSTGTFVGKVIATDEDNDPALTYSIINGNTNSAFEISGTDGNITVHNEEAIDYETTPVFKLMVEVRDSKNGSAASDITINLADVVPPTAGLLLYYPFDGDLNDASGHNNNGINYTSNNYVSGKWGQGLDFNGTSDYVNLSNTINSSSGLSFSFWIKSRGANGDENNGSVICKYNMTTALRCFMVYSFGSGTTRNDNRLSAAFYKFAYSALYHDNTKSYLEPAELTIYPTDPSYWTIVNPERLEIGTWTHCIVNMTDSTLEVWLNGVLCTKKQREYTSYFDSPDEPVYIGNNLAIGDGSNNHFNGILDDLRIYSRGLTADEIRTLSKEK